MRDLLQKLNLDGELSIGGTHTNGHVVIKGQAYKEAHTSCDGTQG